MPNQWGECGTITDGLHYNTIFVVVVFESHAKVNGLYNGAKLANRLIGFGERWS